MPKINCKLGMAIVIVLLISGSTSFATPIYIWHADQSPFIRASAGTSSNADDICLMGAEYGGVLAGLISEYARSHQGQRITMYMDYHLIGAPELTKQVPGGSAYIPALLDGHDEALAFAQHDADKLPALLFVAAKEDIQPRK